MATLKLEVGKYYRTRDGRKVKCTFDDGTDIDPCLVDHGVYQLWHDRNGTSNLDDRFDDVVAKLNDALEEQA